MIRGLDSNNIPAGLTSENAQSLIERYGKNRLPETPPPSDIILFINQVKSPLVYVLLSAAVVTAILAEYTDTAIIGAAVFINTILGFIQERKANNALSALKKMLVPFASVVRDGKPTDIPTEDIVPGDVIILHQGSKIPADGVLSDTNRFTVSEAILTGESIPLEKHPGDKVFMGTIVTGGKGAFVVESTGAKTEMGKIAVSVGGTQSDTPLERQLNIFSKQLSKVVLSLVGTVFILGVLLGKDPVEIFKTSVAMAVSAIPEGLIVALTVVLAIGMQRILRRKGLVRNLKSAETLGGVTTICVDKTGTLTEGLLKVQEVYGNKALLIEQVISANDLDDPIVVSAWEWAKTQEPNYETVRESHERIDSIPFDSNSRIYVSLNKNIDNSKIIYLNGAPEEIITRCSISESDKKHELELIEQLSDKGIRVLGFARKIILEDRTYVTMEDTHIDFEWVGLIGFVDPIRIDVKESLIKAQKAGIKLVVITGDYANTAAYIVGQLGITVRSSEIMLGEKLGSISDADLKDYLTSTDNVKIFARTRPDQKLRIVEVLKSCGEVVAMMGDGVNDAPALSKADIGIVVGEASDVAKESADLILLDSRFSTILAAVEEGRGIFDNIRKVILYLMCDAYVEILLVLISLIFNTPLPITAGQILWINILSDGFPHLALTIDPKHKNLMNKFPRPSSEPLISKWMIKLIALVSVTGAFFAFSVYIIVYKMTGDPMFARSVTFATLGIKSLVYVFSVRTLQNSFWEQNPFVNKWLLVAVSIGLLLAIAPFVYTPLMSFLRVTPLGLYWIFPVVSSLLTFLSIEFAKQIFKNTNN